MTLPVNDAASPFARAYAGLVARGYHVLPIMPGDKAPGEVRDGRWQCMTGWTRHRDEQAPPFVLRLWAKGADGNIGVALGTAVAPGWELGAIDFDTDETFLLEMMEGSVPESNVKKRGRRGYTGFYLVPAGTVGRKWKRGPAVICELLTGTAPRQTIVPPSIHPNTGEPYRWLTRLTLADVAPLDLVRLTADMVERFIDTLEGLEGVAEARPLRLPVPTDGEATPHRALNDAALTNLDAWVPALNLCKLRRQGAGYHAVPDWRPSGTGRPLEQRARNLGIAPTGIKDFGTERTYTAIDLVMAATGWALDETFTWLARRLGLDEEGFGELPEAALPPHDSETGEIIETETLVPVPVVVPVDRELPDALPDREFPDALTRIPGLLGEVLDWIVASSQKRIRPLALGPALVAMGALMGNRVAGPTKAGTHLYVVGLAPSGAGKDHGLKAIGRILDAANASELKGPAWFKSETAVDHFVQRAPVAACGIDEIGLKLKSLLGKQAKGFEAGIVTALMTLWSADPFHGAMTAEWAGKESEETPPTSIGLYGVSTAQAFFSGLTSGEVVNGLLNRWLLLQTDRRMLREDAEVDPYEVPAGLKGRLLDFRGRLNRMTPSDLDMPIGQSFVRVARWGNGARECAQDFERRLFDIEADPDAGPFYGRSWEISIRLATVRAASRDLDAFTVSRDDLEWAQAVAFWSADRMASMASENIAENDRERALKQALSYLARQAGWVKRWQVERAIKCKLRSSELTEILNNLVDSGDVERKRVNIVPGKSGGRPPSEDYRIGTRKP